MNTEQYERVMNSPVWHNNASKLSIENIMTVVLKYFPCAWAICALAAYCLITYHKTIWAGNSFWQRLPFIIHSYSAQHSGVQFISVITKTKASTVYHRAGVQEIAACSPSATKDARKNLHWQLQHPMGTAEGTRRRILMQWGREDDGIFLLGGDPLWFNLLTQGW